jgi:hypothetical protein
MRARAIAGVWVLLAAAATMGAQTPPPVAVATPGPKAPPKVRKGPPLDFTGVWVLDEKASQGVAPQMKGAVLSVRQDGNRIWIEPLEPPGTMLAEEIIVDGKKYEKGVGAGSKGTLEADWGKDGTSLWLQAIVSTDANPVAASQRMIWRLAEGGKVWTRQTRSIQPDGYKDTFLVFRKQSTSRTRTPATTPRP